MYELERADSFAGTVYILLLSRVPLLLGKKSEVILFNFLTLYMHTHRDLGYLSTTVYTVVQREVSKCFEVTSGLTSKPFKQHFLCSL